MENGSNMQGVKASKPHRGNNKGVVIFKIAFFVTIVIATILAIVEIYILPRPQQTGFRVGHNRSTLPPLAQKQSRSSRRETMSAKEVKDLPPELTVIVPLYDALPYLSRLLKNLGNQTYRNLNIIFSIEPTEQAKETDRQLRAFQQEILQNPRSNIQGVSIYNHPNRLYYFDNMNFLLQKVESDFYSYMQCDDLLPPIYYEALVKCLEDHPNAVNCYPENIIYASTESELLDLLKNSKNNTFNGQDESRSDRRQVSVPQHERVKKAVLTDSVPANRGVVRRPKLGPGFTYPRLYKNFFATDLSAMVKQAIAGDILGVTVDYYRLLRDESASNSIFFKNVTRDAMRSLAGGWSDAAVHNYNNGHAFTTSSKDISISLQSFVAQRIRPHLNIMNKKIDGRMRIIPVIKKAQASFLKRIAERKRVAILGAGIQGSLMALMFRKHGYDVTLIDKSNDIMDRTSMTGEGRIHMGLEYANDASMQTAKFMLESSMRFSSYLEYLVGKSLDWSQLKSERLTCLLPHTSHVSPLQFEAYGSRLNDIYEEILAKDPSLSYLGERPPKILIGKTEIPKAVNSSYINAAYESIEVCVLSNKLREVIREALYDNEISMVFERTVTDVQRTVAVDDGLGKFEVSSYTKTGHQFVNRFDAVVNCMWERRAEFDRKMGLDHRSSNESYRVKANVRLDNVPSLHGQIPSVSVMNGPFGDFVRYGPDDKVYFAWHPMSPTIITHNVSDVITEFEGHAGSDFPPGYENHMIEGHKKAFELLFPGYDSSFFDKGIVGTGYVVANGLTDIDDPSSGLHERRDPPNLVVDGYISVKTQKLTNAPYNALLLEKELFEKDSLSQKD